MQYLSNDPVETYQTADQTDHNAFFTKMKHWSDKDYLVFSGTNQNSYVQNHAYAVLKVNEEVISGTTHRYIEMRNPWGSSKWSGAYSKDSAEWTVVNDARIADGRGAFDTEGGKFMIGYTQFMQEFPSVTMNMNAQNRASPNDPVEYRPRLVIGSGTSYVQVRLVADINLTNDFFGIQNFQAGNLIGTGRDPSFTKFSTGYIRESLRPLEGQSFNQDWHGWGAQ